MWQVAFSCLFAVLLGVIAQYEWQRKDAFDEVRLQMDKVNQDNCPIQHVNDLYLPDGSVSHLPNVKDININPLLPNRTMLQHLHNMARSRAFFWSYILQSRFIRPVSYNDTHDPGMMYYFLSTVADVSSNRHVNASAIYFSPNMSYSPSFLSFFNKTFPRFAPRTFRADDFNDPIHLERISTLNTFTVQDLGAVPINTSADYTSDYYRINEWYKLWLPDRVMERHDTKTTYQVEIRYANNTNETFTFHGPEDADETVGPVKWTRPYFDCGRSNRWLVAAVSPIADIYPRHTGFRHIEYPTYTAVSVVEMDFERIDINQCPISKGNEGKNLFAATARCKNTTMCEPLHGWGFRRGGYQCRCNPGYRLPFFVRRPYLGEVVERATGEQHDKLFNCLKTGWIQKQLVQWEKAPPIQRELIMETFHEYKDPSRGPDALRTPKMNIHRVMDFIKELDKNHTCKQYPREYLTLVGGYSFGQEEFFENEAKMALRLANFISAFLQISDPIEVFSDQRVADKPLTEDQMIAETLSLVMGNSRIWSAGTYWERNKFTDRTFFAPYAYKKELNTRKFFVEDLARLNKTEELYLNEEWYQFLKQRWSTNFDSLEKYYMKIKIRFNETGETTKKYEHYPNFYRAATLDQGHWNSPYFDCYGKVPMWKVQYSAPFFGWDSLKAQLEFKGVVAVTMNLMQLDINQCPDEPHVPNAFKGTHKCDKKSSYCVPILGRGFELGGYNCECKQGYEYPYEDTHVTYFDGQDMENEFGNLVENKETRFHTYTCRIAGATSMQANIIIISVTILLCFIPYFRG